MVKVSWQVIGIRQDAWAESNPLVLEEEKIENEWDYYIHPESHGLSAQKSIMEARFPEELCKFERKRTQSLRVIIGNTFTRKTLLGSSLSLKKMAMAVTSSHSHDDISR